MSYLFLSYSSTACAGQPPSKTPIVCRSSNAHNQDNHRVKEKVEFEAQEECRPVSVLGSDSTRCLLSAVCWHSSGTQPVRRQLQTLYVTQTLKDCCERSNWVPTFLVSEPHGQRRRGEGCAPGQAEAPHRRQSQARVPEDSGELAPAPRRRRPRAFLLPRGEGSWATASQARGDPALWRI